MTILICCLLALSLQGIIAKPLNGSAIVLTGVDKGCMCNEDIHHLYRELKETQQRVKAIENITPMDTLASDLPTNIHMKAIYPEVIGFSVFLRNNVLDLPTGSTVLYDGVFYNAGSAYDSSTGVFTCPRSGMYMFAIFVEAVHASPSTLISLMINGKYRVDAVSERFDATHKSTGGNVLVEHIQTGDRVWVNTFQFDNQDLYRGFTTFSGALIQST